jgi:hypothetical protein
MSLILLLDCFEVSRLAPVICFQEGERTFMMVDTLLLVAPTMTPVMQMPLTMTVMALGDSWGSIASWKGWIKAWE